MITLPKILRYNGFKYTQVSNGKRSYVYEQWSTPKNRSYEVFFKKIKPTKFIFRKWYFKREVFPDNEDFGKTAWTFRSYNDALRKFEEIESGD